MKPSVIVIAALAILCAELLPAARAHAQDSSVAPIALKGRVIDAHTRAGIEGADIRIDGTSRGSRTSADGSWTLDLPRGTHRIVVRRLGYLASQVEVNAEGATPVLITLASSPRALDAVVVTAARREQRLKDVAVTTELINRNDIERTGASDVASVLTEQTGMQLTGGHPSGAGVGLQGLSDQRVLVLIDGLPMYGRISGGLDLSRIPASATERIEVVKGPQSTLYGSEAMGGVINILTRGASPGRSGVELRALVGTGRRADTDLLGRLERGPVSLTTNIGHRYAASTSGIAQTAGAMTDRIDAMGSIHWSVSPGLTLDASTLALNERQRWRSGNLYSFADNTQINARIGASGGSATRRFTSSIYVSELDHLSRASEFDRPIEGTGDRQTQRLTQAEVVVSERRGAAALDAGVVARREYITSSDGRIEGGSRSSNSAEPFAQVEIGGARWSVVPGIRVSWSEQWGRYATPRLAMRFRIDSAFTLRTSAGRGFRAPDFKELHLDFVNDAAFYAVRGNPDLRPEHSDNISLGAEWDGARAYARAHVYLNELRDFIETRPLEPAGGIAQYTYGNVARGTTRGLELESGVNLGRARVEGGYAFLAARNYTTRGPLLGQPEQSGRLLLTAPLPGGINASTTGIYTGKTPMQLNEEGESFNAREPYLRVNIQAARQVFGRASISTGINNVFDANPARWPGDTGRHLYVGITWRSQARAN